MQRPLHLKQIALVSAQISYQHASTLESCLNLRHEDCIRWKPYMYLLKMLERYIDSAGYNAEHLREIVTRACIHAGGHPFKASKMDSA